MACSDATCATCKHEWMDNGDTPKCPVCGSTKIHRWFDEDHTEVDCDLKDYYDDEAEVN